MSLRCRLVRAAENLAKLKSGQRLADGSMLWVVSGLHKLDALTRILETENYEGVLMPSASATASAMPAASPSSFPAIRFRKPANAPPRRSTEILPISALSKCFTDIRWMALFC